MTKTLVAYFSESGKIENIVSKIKNKTDADTYKINTIKDYPSNDLILKAVSKMEAILNNRPKLKEDILIDDYDEIYLGFPNWWSNIPMAVYTFLESHDFKDKKIIPFCSHEGDGMGNTLEDVVRACPDSFICDGLSIYSNNITESEVEKWVSLN